MKIILQSENGEWEIAEVDTIHQYKEQPLISIVRQYEKITQLEL